MILNNQLNPIVLRESFQRYRKLHIAGLLELECAQRLYQEIISQPRWNFVFQTNGRHFDLDAEGWHNLDRTNKERTYNIVHEHASKGFTYIHYLLPIYDNYINNRSLTPEVQSLFELLNGDAFLNFARTLTGHQDIGFADAQLTKMGPGHFITIHNDDIEGKNRRAAYVLNMTPNWQEDWGGYLNFYSDDGHIESGFKPAFNALNIFAVPAQHSVSVISPFALESRYVISGWLRAGKNPLDQ